MQKHICIVKVYPSYNQSLEHHKHSTKITNIVPSHVSSFDSLSYTNFMFSAKAERFNYILHYARLISFPYRMKLVMTATLVKCKGSKSVATSKQQSPLEIFEVRNSSLYISYFYLLQRSSFIHKQGSILQITM